MTTPGNSLLMEIILLAERYSPAEWKSALRLLENEKTRRTMISILTVGGHLSRSYKKQTHAKGNVHEADLQRKMPQSKSRVLQAMSKEPTERLRALARDLGLSVSPKDSRKRLIEKIVSCGSRRKTSANVLPSHSDTSEYSNWVKIILDDSRP